MSRSFEQIEREAKEKVHIATKRIKKNRMLNEKMAEQEPVVEKTNLKIQETALEGTLNPAVETDTLKESFEREQNPRQTQIIDNTKDQLGTQENETVAKKLNEEGNTINTAPTKTSNVGSIWEKIILGVSIALFGLFYLESSHSSKEKE